MKSNYKRLGDYIKELKVRNTEQKAEKLLGINIDKFFMPSVANIVGTDLSVYKIVKTNQFACNRMHVGRDYRLPISMSKIEEEFMVSPAYDVFEIKDTKTLNPEYLMMWFTRREFDRNAWFYTDADVRGGLHWKALCDMQLPIPSITKQREIVEEYNVIQDRIKLNEQLIQKLEETAQAVYKRWFGDFEFPDENGQPYKSKGGEMVWCEELGKEIPEGWLLNNLGEVADIKAGGDRPDVFSPIKTETLQVPIYSNSSENEGLYGYTNKSIVQKDSISISARGAIIGFTRLRTLPFVPIVRLIIVTPQQKGQLNYLYETIRKFTYEGSGSAQGQLTIPDIAAYRIILPKKSVLESFQNISQVITKSIEIFKQSNLKLTELKDLLLSKLATVEN